MKKSLVLISLFFAFPVLAAGPQFDNLTKGEVEDVSREFGANFSHTTVSAPETSGLWGVEVGVVGGTAKSPDLQDVVNRSGGDGSDFKNIYSGGLMARVHFPLEIFVEMTYLPNIKVEDVQGHSSSFGLGWNIGNFLTLPFDLAVGINRANGSVSFKQTTPVQSKVDLDTKTTIMWAGISKKFLIFTPYLKAGVSRIEGDLSSTGTILSYQTSQKENVSLTGGYFALGTNIDLLFVKLGLELSRVQQVQKLAAKLSFAF